MKLHLILSVLICVSFLEHQFSTWFASCSCSLLFCMNSSLFFSNYIYLRPSLILFITSSLSTLNLTRCSSASSILTPGTMVSTNDSTRSLGPTALAPFLNPTTTARATVDSICHMMSTATKITTCCSMTEKRITHYRHQASGLGGYGGLI